MINLLAVLLVLLTSGVLIVAFRNGPPPRVVMASLLGVLLVAPILVRWQNGWMIFFFILPWVNFIRRVYYLAEIHMNDWTWNDLFVALPDAIAIVTLVGFLLSRRLQGKERYDWQDASVTRPLKWLIGVSLLGTLNPIMGSLIGGINGFREFTLYLCFYFITREAVRSRGQVFLWFKGLLFFGMLSGAYGAYQYIYGFPSYDQLWAVHYYVTSQEIGDQMRAFSSFSFTSTFSHYMVIAGAAALVAMRMKRAGTFTRLLSPFYLACMLMGLAVTFVRSSYVGLFVAGLVWLVMNARPSVRMKRLVAIGVLTAVMVSVVPHAHGDSDMGLVQQTPKTSELVANRLESLTRPTEVGSMGARFSAWQAVAANSLKWPLGVGMGAGASVRFTGNFGVAALAYTESQFFSMLAELGFPGLILFVWVVIAGMLFTLRVHDRLLDPDLRGIAVFSLMVQAGLSVLGLTGGAVLYTQPGAGFYWTVLGLAAVLPRIEAEEQAREEKIACAAS